MIGGGDDEAVGIILFDHLEETVQDAAHFTDIVAKAAGGADAVEFIEEIDDARAAYNFENKLQLRGRLAHELCVQRVTSNQKQGKTALPGHGRGGKRLSGAGVATEQKRPDEGGVGTGCGRTWW